MVRLFSTTSPSEQNVTEITISPIATGKGIENDFEVVFSRVKSFFSYKEDDSFKNWVSSRFGKTLYEIYFGPYTEKVWGISPDELDPRTASNRIAFNSIFDYLVRSLSFYFLKKSDYDHSDLFR